MRGIHRGFTLIELMIVVAIIGVLASIALAQYRDYVVRANVSEGLTLAENARLGIADFRVARGIWPANNSSAGVAPAASIVGNAVTSVTIASNMITIAYNAKANAGSCSWTATDNAGSISWVCSCTGLSAGQTPPVCR
jgi:type IV pilus assembly protein PilA